MKKIRSILIVFFVLFCMTETAFAAHVIQAPDRTQARTLSDETAQAVISVEAFSLGIGYILPPKWMEFTVGESAADVVSRYLEENDITYNNEAPGTGFTYLAYISGEKISNITEEMIQIPGILQEAMGIEGEQLYEGPLTSLGEFNFTSGSGWMYCVNNVFPNVSMANYFLEEGDVLRLQFTLDYGQDIGAYYAMYGGEPSPDNFVEDGYYPVDNKDEMTKNLAEFLKTNNLSDVPLEFMEKITRLDASTDTDDFKLRWPSDSGEVTRYYGELDDQCAVFNQGISIQSATADAVYSVWNGQVVYKGTSPSYGNLLYINFEYLDWPMQVRYANLAEASSLSVGQGVLRGSLLGTMGAHTGTTATDKKVIALALGASTDGQPCRADGSNVEFINPQDPIFMEFREETDGAYLTQPMAVIQDMNGLSYATESAQSLTNTLTMEEKDRRYQANLDLNAGEAYLRKLVIEVVSELDHSITSENFDENSFLTYNSSTGEATVNIFGKVTIFKVGENAVAVRNSRMVVNASVKSSLFDSPYGRYTAVVPTEKQVQQHPRLEIIRINYLRNKSVEIPGDGTVILNGQGYTDNHLSEMRYGFTQMSEHGCGVIAMHNVLVGTENGHKMNELANWCEYKAVAASGYWGTYAKDIPEFFNELGYETESYWCIFSDQWMNKLENGNWYILAYDWENLSNNSKGSHIVAVKAQADGSIEVYNQFDNKNVAYQYDSFSAMLNGDSSQKRKATYITILKTN